MEHPKGARVLTRIAALVNEDIGQPLGFYGVGHGPYLVLPIPDPSNFRDTTGLVVDTVVYSETSYKQMLFYPGF